MSSLPGSVYVAADKLGIAVFRANRETIRGWNGDRAPGTLPQFCGWYWYLQARPGRAETAEVGPFTSESAAYADAIGKLEQQARSDVRIAKVLRSNALMTGGAYA
jgi:hypothetical protein